MIELNIGLDGVPNSNRLQIGNKYENNDEVIKFILPIEFENYKKYVIAVIKKNNEKVTKVFPITDNQFFVSTDITYISGIWSMYLMCRENEIDLEAEEVDISANNGEHVFISDGFIGVVSDSDIDKELVGNIPMDTNLHIIYEDLLKIKQELIDKINTPASYNDLVDVPTKVSQFENDKKYQTEEEVTALELKITEEINTRESAITELKSDIADVNNSKETHVPAGKVWTSTENGAGWADSADSGEVWTAMQLLASGTFASGTVAGEYKTGLTYADFAKHKRLVFQRFYTGSSVNITNGFGSQNNAGFRSIAKNLAIVFEHIDGYLWKATSYYTDTAVYAPFSKEINAATNTICREGIPYGATVSPEMYVDIRMNERNSWTDDREFVIKPWGTLDADLVWQIWSITEER